MIPTPNIPLLRKAWEFIQTSAANQDGAWYQGQYAQPMLNRQDLVTDCGTSYCLAGYVISIQPGYTSQVKYRLGFTGLQFLHLEEFLDGVQIHQNPPTIDDPNCHFTIAQNLLGLTIQEASDLFSATNGLEEIEQYLRDIFARAGEEL